MDDVMGIAEQFAPRNRILSIQECGSGILNDTFRVLLDAVQVRYFILQRVNTSVFRRPELVMSNIHTLTGHMLRRLERKVVDLDRRWEVPQILVTKDGQDHYVDRCGSYWRALNYISHSVSHDTVHSLEHAREIGYALGLFHNLVSDLDVSTLCDTLPGFHVAPQYIAHYDRVLSIRDSKSISPLMKYGIRFIEERRGWASILENARQRNELCSRPIHGDTKINNFLIDQTTGRAVSIIDLDTVKPGLVHYDVGDCARSCCNPLGEETENIEDVRFDTDLCRAVLEGYLVEAKWFLSKNDFAYLYDAIRLIAFELGLRFFTDYMEGSIYFKTKYQEHNLMRALVQFRLTESIEFQEPIIRTIIGDLTR